MNTPHSASVKQPDPARTSLAFRIWTSALSCLFVLLGAGGLTGFAPPDGLAWAAALLAGGCVFLFSGLLLPALVVALPPGLLVVALVTILTR